MKFIRCYTIKINIPYSRYSTVTLTAVEKNEYFIWLQSCYITDAYIDKKRVQYKNRYFNLLQIIRQSWRSCTPIAQEALFPWRYHLRQAIRRSKLARTPVIRHIPCSFLVWDVSHIQCVKDHISDWRNVTSANWRFVRNGHYIFHEIHYISPLKSKQASTHDRINNKSTSTAEDIQGWLQYFPR